MNTNDWKIMFPVSILLISVIACGIQSTPQVPATEAPVQPSPVVEPSPGPTMAPTLVLVPTDVQIQHTLVPGELPVERANQALDQDSSTTADQKRAPGGDRFTFARFERPFNATTMDVYFPYLDIVDTFVFQDEVWIFGVIILKEPAEGQSLPGKYALEIDSDIDGRGDWLILADQPATSEWSVDGVQVWLDGDNDVGGGVPVYTDDIMSGNGFETMLFENGLGDDPDLAWARIDPLNPSSVQIAFKRTLLDGDPSFIIGMWAGNSLLDPSQFDINDHFTHKQAGSSLVEFEFFYPLKEVSELDNACRMPVGFQSSGKEPGLCVSDTAPVEEKEEEGCDPAYWICFNFGAQRVCYCTGP